MQKNIEFLLQEMRQKAKGGAVISSSVPFNVLISTILSQRTKDKNTEKATKQLFAKYSRAKEIAAAQAGEIRKLIRPAGFYNMKAKRIKEASRQIAERFNGKVPADLEKLLSLPGVGRKTANCVLVYGFGIPAIPVDVHVHRVSNRIGLVKAKTPEETEKQLRERIPEKHWIELNNLFVRYGQAVCLPRSPKCMECAIRPNCDYFSSTQEKKQFK